MYYHMLADCAYDSRGVRVSAQVLCGINFDPYASYTFTDYFPAVHCDRCKTAYQDKEHAMPLARLDSPITEDKLKVIGKIHARGVNNAMNLEGVSERARRATMNRLYNNAHSDAAEEMTVAQLFETPGWKRRYVEINIPAKGISGTLDDIARVSQLERYVVRVADQDYVATYDTTVRVWRREQSSEPERAATKIDRCPAFCYEGGVGSQCPYKINHIGQCLFENLDIASAHPEPSSEPVIQMAMKNFYDNHKNYISRTIQIRHVAFEGPIKGVYTDIWCTIKSPYASHRSQYTLVIDGKMYSENGDHMVYIFENEQQCGKLVQRKYYPVKVCTRLAEHTGLCN